MVKRKVRLRIPAFCGHLEAFPDGQDWEGRLGVLSHLGERDQPLPLSYFLAQGLQLCLAPSKVHAMPVGGSSAPSEV